MPVLRAILLSLAIHFVLMLALENVPASWILDRMQPDLTDVVLIEKDPTEDKHEFERVVRQADAPENLKEDLKDKARFLSESEQRVLQETQARRTGLTRNGRALPENSWMKTMRQPPQSSTPAQQAQERAERDGYEPIRIPKASEMPRTAFEDAPSTVGELLPDDVALGDFTALNTDRFKYYSFYSRVEELVRFRWERGLQQALNSFDRQYLLGTIGRRTWLTRIEFWLTPDGKFHSAHLHKESGVRRFDLAAVNAFKDAAFFPNPPREMVEKDGFIHLQYSFNVRWSPSVLVDGGP